MKRIKKLTSLLLVAVMLFAMSTTAFAADKTITMTSSLSGASVENHTYAVYQIFTGDVSTKGNVLSNAAYGQNYTVEGKTVDEAIAELSKMNGEAAAEFLNTKIAGDPIATLSSENNWSATVPTGYYLIVDVSKNLPATEKASAFVLELVGDTEIKSKHDSTPVTEKKVDDKNDTTGEEDAIVWQDSADHDINDVIDFQISATIPSDFGAFKEANEAYRFAFHDKESAGLTFQADSVKAYVVNDGVEKEITSGYTVVTACEDGCTFEVIFADLTQINEVTVGSKIVVKYKSKLNENAIIGPTGNPNEMRGEFSNFNTPETPEFTPWDKVIVFTYEYDVDKIDGQSKEPLKGAGFTLYKQQPNGNWVAVSNEIKGEEITTFEFKGLDDGTYKLEETTVPDGYNKAADVVFTITATHDEESEDPKLIELNVTNVQNGEVNVGKDTEGKLTGKLDSDVVNNEGTTLPETGGVGTTMFYVIGAILMVGAAVVMITRKRMSR